MSAVWVAPTAGSVATGLGYAGSATFTSVPFPNVTADRIILFSVEADSAFGNVTATINGNAAIPLTTSAPAATLFAYQDNGALGTSGSIEVFDDGNGLVDVGIAVGALSGVNAVPSSVIGGAVVDNTADPIVANGPITIPVGGIAIFLYTNIAGTTDPTFSDGGVDLKVTGIGSGCFILLNDTTAGTVTPSFTGVQYNPVEFIGAAFAATGAAAAPQEGRRKGALFAPNGRSRGPTRGLSRTEAFPVGVDNVVASPTLGALTVSATATATDKAVASITLGALTVVATATALDQASASIALGALTSVATATAPVAADQIGKRQGFLFKPGAGPTWNMRGRAAFPPAIVPTNLSATASITLDALTVAATAAVPASASAAVTLGGLANAATVSDPDTATAANTLAPLTAAATAAVKGQASASITLDALTSSATVSDMPGAAATVTLAPVTLAATATVVDAAVASVTLGALTSTSAAAVTNKSSAAIGLAAATSAAAATAPEAASAPVTLGQMTASSIVVNLVKAQGASITLDAMTLASTARHPPPSTSNSVALMI